MSEDEGLWETSTSILGVLMETNTLTALWAASRKECVYGPGGWFLPRFMPGPFQHPWKSTPHCTGAGVGQT